MRSKRHSLSQMTLRAVVKIADIHKSGQTMAYMLGIEWATG